MTTMIDVANHAGVSLKTVSRVINNEPHVQPKLREKVKASVAYLGYVPSASARSLRSTRSYNIHMVFETWTNSFANNIQFGVVRAAQELGYRLVLNLIEPADLSSEKSLKTWIDRLAQQGRPDGVILVPPLSDDKFINQQLLKAGVDVIRIGPNELEDLGGQTILIDDREAAKTVTEYLIGLGHQRIAFIRGKEDQLATPLRYQGFSEAMNEAGLAIDPKYVLPGNFEFEAGREAAQTLFKLANPPTAIFAANDTMAAGVLVTAHRMGLDAPKDLSVIGFDDTEISRSMWPALTTIRQPLQDFGIEAVRAIVDKVESHRTDTTRENVKVLPFEFIERESSGPRPS